MADDGAALSLNCTFHATADSADRHAAPSPGQLLREMETHNQEMRSFRVGQHAPEAGQRVGSGQQGARSGHRTGPGQPEPGAARASGPLEPDAVRAPGRRGQEPGPGAAPRARLP